MQKPARGKTQKRNAYVIWMLLAIVVCALLIYLTGGQNALKEVRVTRNGGADSALYVTDEQIIRASGLKMGAGIGSVEDMSKLARKGVDALGYVTFVSMRRESRHTVEIVVEARTPAAVLDFVGNRILIDDEGYVIAHLDALPTYDVVYVTGAQIEEHIDGRMVITEDAKQLENILGVVRTIRQYGYGGMCSELNVKNIRKMYLVTNTRLLVYFYNVEDVLGALDYTKGIIDQGITQGEVIVSGGRAAYRATENTILHAD